MLVSMRTRGQDRTRMGFGAITAGFTHCQSEAYGADVAQKKMIVPRSQSRRIAACLVA